MKLSINTFMITYNIILLLCTASFAIGSEKGNFRSESSICESSHKQLQDQDHSKNQLLAQNYLKSEEYQEKRADFFSRYHSNSKEIPQSVEDDSDDSSIFEKKLYDDLETVKDWLLEAIYKLKSHEIHEQIAIWKYQDMWPALTRNQKAFRCTLKNMLIITNGEDKVWEDYDIKISNLPNIPSKKVCIELCNLSIAKRLALHVIVSCYKAIERSKQCCAELEKKKLDLKQRCEQLEENRLNLQNKKNELNAWLYHHQLLKALRANQKNIVHPYIVTQPIFDSEEIQAVINYLTSLNHVGMLLPEIIKNENKDLFLFTMQNIPLENLVISVTLFDGPYLEFLDI